MLAKVFPLAFMLKSKKTLPGRLSTDHSMGTSLGWDSTSSRPIVPAMVRAVSNVVSNAYRFSSASTATSSTRHHFFSLIREPHFLRT